MNYETKQIQVRELFFLQVQRIQLEPTKRSTTRIFRMTMK